MAVWLVVSLAIVPLSAYFFFTMALVTIVGTVNTPYFSETDHHATEAEVARFGNELELGFSTSVSCRGYSYPTGEPTDYCYTGAKLTVYRAYQLKDILNLAENPQCTLGTDYSNHYQYCGGVEYQGFHHDVAIRMPYEQLYTYYLYGVISAGVGAGVIMLLWKRRTKIGRKQVG